MRSEDGKQFQNVVGITDRAIDTGEEFHPNMLKLDFALNVGDTIKMGNGTVYQYRGEDNLGCSIFTLPGQFVTAGRF
jgi:hypothetical protein